MKIAAVTIFYFVTFTVRIVFYIKAIPQFINVGTYIGQVETIIKQIAVIFSIQFS